MRARPVWHERLPQVYPLDCRTCTLASLFYFDVQHSNSVVPLGHPRISFSPLPINQRRKLKFA